MPQIVIKLGDSVVQNFAFEKDIVNVGRSRDNDITIDNLAVSRSHCRVRHVDDKYILTDLNSANGTYVNGVKITKTELMDKDVISIGKHKLIFEAAAVQEEEAIGEAFGADRTMIQESTVEGVLKVVKGKGATKGQEYRVVKYETTIGRAPECDVVLNDWFVSKTHAKIIKQNASFVLKDLGSWKGSFINESPVKEPVTLKDGDELRFGSTRFEFSVYDEKKKLQVELRRPQELGYDESSVAASVAAANAASARPAPASEPMINRAAAAAAATEPPIAPPRPKAPSAPSQEISGAPLNFDDLPEPTMMNVDAAAMLAAAHAAQETPPPAARQAAPSFVMTPSEPIPMAEPGKPFATWQDFTASAPAPQPARVVTPLPPPPPSNPPASASGTGSRRRIPASAPSAPLVSVPPPFAGPNMTPPPPTANDTPSDERTASQVAMWEKALQNKSPLIRKQAAKMLKKLTGRDYEA